MIPARPPSFPRVAGTSASGPRVINRWPATIVPPPSRGSLPSANPRPRCLEEIDAVLPTTHPRTVRVRGFAARLALLSLVPRSQSRRAPPNLPSPRRAELRGSGQVTRQLLAYLDLVAQRSLAEGAVQQHLEWLSETKIVLVEAHVLLGMLLPGDLHNGRRRSVTKVQPSPFNRKFGWFV